MTIKQTHDILFNLLDKERNGHISHEKADELLHTAQVSYFSFLIGNLKRYPNGSQHLDTNQVRERLGPFRERILFLNVIKDSFNPYGVLPDGLLTLPDDFEAMSAVMSYVDGKDYPIEVLDDEEWAGRSSSELLEPSNDCAIAKMHGSKSLRLLPKNLTGHVWYYRAPKKPLFYYTLDGRIVEHDPLLSQDLEWNTVATMDIIKRALILAGVKVDDTLLYQAMSVEEQKE